MSKLPIITGVIILLIICAFSCKQAPDPSLLVSLSKSTYLEELKSTGVVEAVNSHSITGPSNYSGNIIKFLVEDGTYVKKGDTVCIVENTNIQNNYETMVTRIETTKARFTTTQANLDLKYAMLQAELENIDAQSAITSLDSLQIQYLSPLQKRIKELQLEQARIRREKIKKNFDYLKPINDAELKSISLQIKRDSIQSLTYKDMLDAMVLTSPADGMVLREPSIWKEDGAKFSVGEQCLSYYPILTIPEMSSVKVSLMVAEAYYRRIAVGDSVLYTFDAMPGNMAWGKVQTVEPMGQPVTRNSKVKNFKIIASVDSFKVIPEPGLSANCRIILHEVKDTIVVPQLAIHDEDSIKVVYTYNGRNYDRKEVLLAESSLKEAVVSIGLDGNETLALIKPPGSQIRNKIFVQDSIKEDFKKQKQNDSVPASKSNVILQSKSNNGIFVIYN